MRERVCVTGKERERERERVKKRMYVCVRESLWDREMCMCVRESERGYTHAQLSKSVGCSSIVRLRKNDPLHRTIILTLSHSLSHFTFLTQLNTCIVSYIDESMSEALSDGVKYTVVKNVALLNKCIVTNYFDLSLQQL